MGLFDFLRRKKKASFTPVSLKDIWHGFQRVLAANNKALMLMGELEERYSRQEGFNLPFLRAHLAKLDRQLDDMVVALQKMSGQRWSDLLGSLDRMRAAVRRQLESKPVLPSCPALLDLAEATPGQLAALGGKGAHLALVAQDLRLPVPPGVVATLTAYQMFLDYQPEGETASLRQKLQRQLASFESEPQASLAEQAAALQTLVSSHPLPPSLTQALINAGRKLAAQPHQSLAVRSSGSREDLSASLAGLFDSFLAVAPEEVPDRWRQVVASQFGPAALAYFQEQGIRLEEVGMAVLIQQLVEAQVAGVLFTTDPRVEDADRLLVGATWGLAADLVQDLGGADEYLVSKEDGRLLQSRLGHKEQRLTLAAGRLQRQPVAPPLVDAPALESEDLQHLTALSHTLEEFFLAPQDVEWAKDAHGHWYVVQSRPLKVSNPDFRRTLAMNRAAAGAEVILEDCRVAAPGVAAGPVFRLQDVGDLEKVPAGVVLLVPRTSPQLAPVLGRIEALVTARGSATGHLALLSREYGKPMLVDTLRASDSLAEGVEITVDAYHGKIYRGRVEKLLRFRRRPAPSLVPSPFHDQMLDVIKTVIPLTLIDPRQPDFRAELCRTYHDFTFYCHHKAIEIMLGLIDGIEAGRLPALKLLKLDTDLPLNLHLIDLGEGLAGYETPVPPAAILSRPMKALWRGISHPDITWAGPVPVSVGGFLHVLGQSAIRPPERFWDKTYAIVATNYVNYACRLGYHFSGVDSYLSDTADFNYINFTFKGGAADETRRIRRVKFIALVLDQLGFEVEVHLDVIQARYRKRPLAETEEKLELLGRLMAYVRQLDMLMSDEAMIAVYAERFLTGHYERPEAPPAPA